MAEFPFFKDSTADYPAFDGLTGSSYRDTFDYIKYQRPATLRIISVPWRSDYKDVVRFDDERARDAWLSSAEGNALEYSTPWLRIPEQTINLPLPYEAASHFNYLYVDAPILPVDDSRNPTRLCYFVTGIRYAAPSTTSFDLELDFWQTYGYRMEVSSLMLERGHAPMYRTNVDDYLENPIENNGYLLAKDIDFSGGSDRIAGVEHYPIGSGVKSLIMALPIKPEDISVIGDPFSSSVTAPVYSDTAARNGYQYQVDNYDWGFTGLGFPNALLPVSPFLTSDTRTLDGTFIYAIDAPDAYDALSAMQFYFPQVIKAIKYLALVPTTFVQRHPNYQPVPGESEDPGFVDIAGFDWQVIDANPTVALDGFELTKNSIGLPDYAQDIAKLYTFPYTRLEVSDNEGRAFEVRIEDIAGDTLEVMLDISLASSSLICNIECPNIGTDSSYTLDWKLLDDSTLRTTLYGSDLAAHMIEWGIPTYEVSAWAGSEEAAKRWAQMDADRGAALNAYHQAVRSANTALANVQAANQTAVTNTANSGTTAQSNQTAANGRDNTITAQNTTTNSSLASLSHQQAYDLSAADDEFQMYAVDVGNWGSAMAGVNNAVGALASGNVMGAMSTGFGAALSITTNQAMADLAEAALLAKQGATVNYIDAVATAQNTATSNNNATAVNAATAINNNNVALANTNATNSANTSNANAGYTRDDAVTGAKENLELAQQRAEAQIKSASLESSKIGYTSGDNALDALARRAFVVRARTQSDYALKATADYFTRYGYALDAPIYPDSWLEQGEYCYWQGSRAIIKGDVPDMYRTALERILEQGFTVWSSPEKVGRYEID